MPLKKSEGNMYAWVTHTHSHLAGKCPHECVYCYVSQMAKKFPNMRARYSGPIRLIEDELNVDYGTDKTIFVEHMGDLFAEAVPARLRSQILEHCRQWPENTYVFQSKNPYGMVHEFDEGFMPAKPIIGTTVETNYSTFDNHRIWNPRTPIPMLRLDEMLHMHLYFPTVKTFVTIEPILDFDLLFFSCAIIQARPSWVNIGADSKSSGLPEPKWAKVEALIDALTKAGIEVRQKTNLDRLKSK